MSFDWLTFLRSRQIEYVTSGPNVSAGSVAINCPYCGGADPSQHLVIRLNGKGWFCWREKAHRGGSPVRLVATLLGCSFEQAQQITGYDRHLPPTDFLGSVKALLDPPPIERERRKLSLPAEFRSLTERSGKLFRNYLYHDRGFEDDDILAMTREYDVRFCMRGAYSRRIVFPVYYMEQLVGWTARSIDPTAFIRYRTLSQDREKSQAEGYDPAIGPINDYLLWYDDLIEQTEHDRSLTLLVCEGPMDGLKVNILGRRHNIRATCVFTSSPTDAQTELLYELIPRFHRAFIFLDQGAQHAARRIQSDLSALHVGMIEPPRNRKDPGELRSFCELQSALER
jgi:hypothetical protein